MKTTILTTIFSLCASLTFAQGVLYVDQSAKGNNDGSSWADAFVSLDDALSASSHDSIYVAKGVYKPGDGTKRTDFFELTSHCYGGFNGTETNLSQRDIKANPTILSGDYLNNDDNDLSPSNLRRSENAQTVCRYRGKDLSGFIIEGGNANGSSAYANFGAGIYCYGNFNGKVTDCIFRNNSANYNSAIHFSRSGGLNSWLRIDRCEFYNNYSQSGVIGQQGLGTHGSYLYVFNSLFYKNTVTDANVSGLITLNLTNYGGTTQGALHAEIVHNTFVNNSYLNNGSTIVAGRNGAQGTSFLNVLIQNNIFMHQTIPAFKERVFANSEVLSTFYFNYNLTNNAIGTYNAERTQNFENRTDLDLSAFVDAANHNYQLKDCKNNAHRNAQFIADNDASFMDKNGVKRDSFVRDIGCYALIGIPKVQIQRQANTLILPNTHEKGYWLLDSTPFPSFLGEKASLTPHKNGFYSVLSMDTASKCWSKSEDYNFFFASVNDHVNAPVMAYPNPTQGMFKVDDQWVNGQLTLIDQMGKVVYIIGLSQLSVDITNLPGGLYHGIIQKQDKIGTFNVVKQ